MNSSDGTIHSLIEKWDGVETQVGIELWQQLRSQIETSGEAILALISMARTGPKKLGQLLRINNSAFVLSGRATYAECMVAVLLTAYGWAENSLYRIMLKVVEKPSGFSRSTASGGKLFCHLSWVFHCLIVFFPGLFPNIRKGFQLTQTHNHEPANILDLMPTSPGRLVQCISMLPFQSPRTFLACFGANKIGQFLVGDPITGLTRSGFPPVDKIFRCLELCEAKLCTRSQSSCAEQRGNTISDEDASIVAKEVFGIHPSYWAFHSSKLCGLQGYIKMQGILSKTWDDIAPEGWDAANQASRRKYNKLKRTKKHMLLKRKATEEQPVEAGGTDLQTDSFLDTEPSSVDRNSAKTKWLAKIKLQEQPVKKKIKRHPAFQFKPSL